MKKYTVKILSDKEFESLPYPDLNQALGVADPKTDTAYIRNTNVDEANKYLINHEVEHLIEGKGGTHGDHYRNGVYYKDLGSIVKPIGDAFGGISKGIGSVGQGAFNLGKSAFSNIPAPNTTPKFFPSSSKTPSALSSFGLSPIIGSQGSSGFSLPSLPIPGGSPSPGGGSPGGGGLSGFLGGLGKAAKGAGKFLFGENPLDQSSGGGGFGGFLGSSLGQTALGGALSLFGQKGAEKRAPQVPDLSQLPSIQRLSQVDFRNFQELDPELVAATERDFAEIEEGEIKELRDVFKNLQPGVSVETSSTFKREVERLRQRQGERRADTLARLRFDFIGKQLQASELEMQQLAQLANMDLTTIMLQLGLDAQSAQNFKETFQGIGTQLISSGLGLNQPISLNLGGG